MSTPESRPRASIIVRCLNEERHIGRLLAGIEEQTVREHEIIVVDSGSTDSTVAIASRFPTRILHIDPAEFTFGRSLNIGCRAARGEFLVLVSAHCFPVYRDWLAELLARFDHEDVALVYGKQRGDESTSFAEQRIFERWFPDSPPEGDDRHPFCNNANAAVRRSAWQEQPYDEELTGLEDIDWAKGAIGRGHRIVYSPEAEVVHVHDETAAQVLNRYRREAIALQAIYPEERFHAVDFLRLLTTNVAGDVAAAGRRGLLPGAAGDILRFRTLQFLGTYLGFRGRGRVSSELKRRMYYPDRPTDGSGSRPAAEPVDYARHEAPSHAGDP